jgi:alcohol dehydrogenase class IV
MSRPIGAHFHVPHGLSNAMLLPAITRFSVPAAPARYAAAARQIGLAQPDDPDDRATARLVAGLEALNRELGVPTPAAFGIDEAAWTSKLPLMAQQALASGSPANNPRVPDAGEIVALYNEVWTGAPRNAAL